MPQSPAQLSSVHACVGVGVAVCGSRPLGGLPRRVPAADVCVGDSGGILGGGPQDERISIYVIKAIVPLRIGTWNSQALLGSMFSRAGRITRKRRELEKLLDRSEVVLIQEAHGTVADLELLPSTHCYSSSLGDYGAEEASSLWGGVVIAVSKTLVQRSLAMRSVTVVRGRVLQVDLDFRCGGLRIVCVHVDPSLSLPGLRGVFSLLRNSCADSRRLTLLAGDFNLLAPGDVRYHAGGGHEVQGDGVRGEVADTALADLLELHQPGWTYRRFRDGCLYGASRIDRVYLSLSPAAFSMFVASAAVVGDVFDRTYPSDHMPVMARLALARRRDSRIQAPIDRRAFEALAFFDVLARRCAVVSCATVAEAQALIVAVKKCLRGLAGDFQYWPFVSGVPTERDKARLAVRAWRAWLGRRAAEVQRCCNVWGALADRFDEGELRDPVEMRAWVSELTEAEAHEEEERVRRGPEPETQKAQASERIRRRAAKWRLRSLRVHLRGLLDETDSPLLDGAGIGSAVSSFWGSVFGREHACEDSEAENWFLDSVPDLSQAAPWHVTRGDVRKAASRIGHSALGPDGGRSGCQMRFSRCFVQSAEVPARATPRHLVRTTPP